MKECPNCHTRYDDTMNFCIKDGCQLVDVNTDNFHKGSVQATPNKKKGGCLKKIVIAVIIAVILMVAFYNYIMNAATYLRTEPNQIGAVKAGGECKVEIDYDGYVWLINHKPDRVDIEEDENDFVIKANPNVTGQAREGSITIQSGKQLAQVIVRQMGYATRMTASENNLKFTSSGGNKTLFIETDGCGWKAQFPDWISIEDDDDEVAIACQENTGEYRTGSIVFKEDNVSTMVYVTQGGMCGNCHGEGEVTCTSCWGQGGTSWGMYYSQCFWCGGSGKIKCSTCDGTGERE